MGGSPGRVSSRLHGDVIGLGLLCKRAYDRIGDAAREAERRTAVIGTLWG